MRIAIAAALISAMFASQPCYSQTLTKAERPDVKVGDKWVYQSSNALTGIKEAASTSTVTEVTPEKVVTTSERSRFSYNRDWNLMETRQGESVSFAAKPYRPRYLFPLEVGKTLDQQYEYFTRGGQRTYQGHAKLRVVGR